MLMKKPKSSSSDCNILKSKPKLIPKEFQDAIFNSISIGLEYDQTISNDRAFVTKILESDLYLPQNDFIIDFNYEFSKLMELNELKDERSKGTFFGMAVLGVVGFFAFSFTIIGGIAGGVLGIILGRYAGKKIVRKAKHKTCLTEFELFTTKLECLLKWMKLERKKCQFNINNYRFVLEKSISNKNQKKYLIGLIKKMRKELKSPRNQVTVLLSYRLFKSYMKANPDNKQIIANIINNVFVPLCKIYAFQAKSKVSLKFNLFDKLQKFLKKENIKEFLIKYPDIEISPELKSLFLKNLNVKINITKTMLEFFGTNPFLQNLFMSEKENLEIFNENREEKVNQISDSNSKNSSDPILDNLIQTFHKEEKLNKGIHLKTIFSEEESSIFSVNNEDVILEIPKNSFNSNNLNGDKMQKPSLKSSEKQKELMKKSETSRESEEIKNPSVSKFEESKNSSKNLKEETPNTQSFAMNRRGDEFLKMPSLKVLSEESPSSKFYLRKHQNEEQKQQIKSKLHTQEDNPKGTNANSNKKEDNYNNLMQWSKPIKNIDPVVEKNFDLIVDYLNEDVSTWDKVTKNKFLEVHRRKVPGSPCVLIKATAILENISKQMIFDQIYIIDKRKKWDTVFGEFKQIEQIDDVTDVIYFLINSPFGVVNRDFLQKRVYRLDFPVSGSYGIQFKSIDHPLVPNKKNCIRAETFISGYIISSDPRNSENSILQLITQVDVKGSIPKSIVNYVASKAPIDWVNNLKKACLKNN